MRRHRRRIVIAVLVVLAALAGAALYSYHWVKAGGLRSVDTHRGDQASTNDAQGDPPKPRRRTPAAPAAPDVVWPNFRFDERGTGVNPDAIARPPFQRRWVFNAKGLVELPPAIDNGVMVVNSYRTQQEESNVWGVDLANGKAKWRHRFPRGGLLPSSPAVTETTAFVASLDGTLTAYGLQTGRQRWQFRAGPMESSPIVSAGTVYVGSWDKRLYAIDAATGKPRWSFATGDKVKGSVSLTPSTVFFGSYDGNVYALNRQNGAVRWRTSVELAPGRGVPFYSTPSLGLGRVYIGGNDGSVYALDAVDGHQIWRFGTSNYVYASPTLYNGRLYFGNFDGDFFCVDAQSGSQVWRFDTNGQVLGSSVVAGGIVYFSTLSGQKVGRTYGLDPNSGKVAIELKGGSYTPLIADRNWVYFVHGLNVQALEGAR